MWTQLTRTVVEFWAGAAASAAAVGKAMIIIDIATISCIIPIIKGWDMTKIENLEGLLFLASLHFDFGLVVFNLGSNG